MAKYTTVAVDERTMTRLQEMKRESGAASYGEVIVMLLEKSKRVPKSMRGAFPKLKPMTREEEMEIAGKGHD